MGQALYRTYRSKSLAEVVGQEHITKTLANAIKSGRISHAYLFTGPRGTGKTSTARILAHDINAIPYTGQPHLDIIEIDAASNRRIDDIRDLRDKVHIAPISASYKVYIIDEVHMLTSEAFNALLKTLEEPPKHVIFIMATTEAHKLPATIISRAQRYSFRPAEVPTVIQHLKHISKQEKITVDNDSLTLIAEHGEGSFRDSISLLDQLANVSDGQITGKLVEQTLGLAPRENMQQLMTAILDSDQPAILSVLEKLALAGTTTTSLLAQLLRTLRTAAPKEPSLYQLIDNLLEVPRAYDPHLKLLTTLMKFTNHDKPQPTPVTKRASVSATIVEPLLDIAIKTSSESTQGEQADNGQVENDVQIDNNKTEVAKKLDDISEQQWQAILDKVKQKNQPVFVVLRMANWSFDSSTQTLNLGFKFQLHRNKIDNAKSKSMLSTILATQLGGAPVIKTELIKQPQQVQPTIADPTAISVIEVMGGGELVNQVEQAI